MPESNFDRFDPETQFSVPDAWETIELLGELIASETLAIFRDDAGSVVLGFRSNDVTIGDGIVQVQPLAVLVDKANSDRVIVDDTSLLDEAIADEVAVGLDALADLLREASGEA